MIFECFFFVCRVQYFSLWVFSISQSWQWVRGCLNFYIWNIIFCHKIIIIHRQLINITPWWCTSHFSSNHLIKFALKIDFAPGAQFNAGPMFDFDSDLELFDSKPSTTQQNIMNWLPDMTLTLTLASLGLSTTNTWSL